MYFDASETKYKIYKEYYPKLKGFKKIIQVTYKENNHDITKDFEIFLNEDDRHENGSYDVYINGKLYTSKPYRGNYGYIENFMNRAIPEESIIATQLHDDKEYRDYILSNDEGEIFKGTVNIYQLGPEVSYH